MKTLDYITPGDVLREEFLEPMGISGRQFAREPGVPANRISRLLKGERTLTAETAIVLAKRLNTSPEFWLNLQNSHDLEKAYDTLKAKGIPLSDYSPKSNVA